MGDSPSRPLSLAELCSLRLSAAKRCRCLLHQFAGLAKRESSHVQTEFATKHPRWGAAPGGMFHHTGLQKADLIHTQGSNTKLGAENSDG